jgi:hypothetical protein
MARPKEGPMKKVLVFAALVVLAACGEDSRDPYVYTPPPDLSSIRDSPALDPPDCDRNTIDCVTSLGEYLAASEGFAGMQADSFVLAYQVCSVYPPKDFVDQGFDTPGNSEDPVDVALAYAEETFTPASQQAGYEGCLSAFEGRP